ncbi:MAG: septum formation initiator family protein [Lachnospiraceae bacterium]|nr:septum formation initiator family protein [Lachnospiraceae bacterium]
MTAGRIRTQNRIRRNAKRRRREHQTAVAFLLCIACLFAVVMSRGITKAEAQLATLEAEEQSLEEELASEEARSEELEEQRVYVQTKAYIEEAAKKLGYVYPDEVIFVPSSD